jgi:hypothetical protein
VGFSYYLNINSPTYEIELSDVIAAAVAKANVCWVFFIII